MPAHTLTLSTGATLPIRDPHPLDVCAAWQSIRQVPADAPYVAISLLGEGIGQPRRDGVGYRLHARQITDHLGESVEPDDLMSQAQIILADWLEERGIQVRRADVDRLGESSTTRTTSSPTDSGSHDDGRAMPSGG